MAGETGYVSQDELIGRQLANLLNPPDQPDPTGGVLAEPDTPQVSTVQRLGLTDSAPRGRRATSSPSQQAQPMSRPAAPSPSPAVPPAPTPPGVTPSGTGPTAPASQKSWPDYVRAANDKSLSSLDQAQAAANALQNQPSATTQNTPIEQRRLSYAAPIPYRDPITGKVMTSATDPLTGETINPKKLYQPGIGTRILRAVLPGKGDSIPINAPNSNYRAAEAQRQAQAGAIESQEQRNIANEKADSERLRGIGTLQKDVATGYKDVAGAATSQQNAENKEEYNQQLADIKKQLADQSGDKLPTNDTTLAIKSVTETDPAKKNLYKQALAIRKQMVIDEKSATRTQSDRRLDAAEQRELDAAAKVKDQAVAKAQAQLDKMPNSVTAQKAAMHAMQDAQDAYADELQRHGQTPDHLTIGNDLVWRNSGGKSVSRGATPQTQPAQQPARPAAAPAQTAPRSAAEVQQGQVYKGHQYLGGDWHNPASWKWVGQGPDPFKAKRGK